jgi:hypothetical protein
MKNLVKKEKIKTKVKKEHIHQWLMDLFTFWPSVSGSSSQRSGLPFLTYVTSISNSGYWIQRHTWEEQSKIENILFALLSSSWCNENYLNEILFPFFSLWAVGWQLTWWVEQNREFDTKKSEGTLRLCNVYVTCEQLIALQKGDTSFC